MRRISLPLAIAVILVSSISVALMLVVPDESKVVDLVYGGF
jgi:hypothetical protein